MRDSVDVMQLLANAGEGDKRAIDHLLPLVYDELRSIASNLMRSERADHTFDPTVLVHEAYTKLVDQTRAQWRDKAHFFAVAAQAMRRILIDHARRRNTHKRGGQRSKLLLTDQLIIAYDNEIDLIELDDALKKLAEENEDYSRLVELRFFAGLTIADTATILNTSTSSVERQWRYVRAKLYHSMMGESQNQPKSP